MKPGVVTREVTRGDGTRTTDHLAVEEPLEIRIAGDTLAITMRTPGDDPKLAIGFLLAEGLIESIDDVGTITHCGRPGDEGYGNVIEVTPASGAIIEVEKMNVSRRGTLTTAACGVCGRRSVDDLLARLSPLATTVTLPRAVLLAGPEKLRTAQQNFELTGGVHAAAAFAADGRLLAAFEDVGRHNAVDKVVGSLALAKVPGAVFLQVSGRASFEIVQKAWAAGFSIVASVSAPSSLAVELADRAGITLAGFVRGDRFTLYSHPERIAV